MKRTPVKSSNIKSVGYDPKTKTLEVEFSTGSVHQYLNMPVATHRAFLKAGSVGGYFYAHIRNFYQSKEIK